MLKNATNAEKLVAHNNKSVDDGGTSDAEGGEECENNLLKDTIQNTSIERRDHDNMNSKEDALAND